MGYADKIRECYNIFKKNMFAQNSVLMVDISS